ncbi:NAD(P)H-dependent oxidoreductase [Oceanicaulis alexandrii]|uniref:NAD(P)H-dependent oxidoreductase n=1 Tax=Oceanicaulis alexandrii TaxID=153233 RepID=UPI0035CFA7F8
MSKKVFIWVAHPRLGSFNHALAQAYATGAEKGGASVRIQAVSEMQYEAFSEGYEGKPIPLEPDLKAWQDNLLWADHVVFVTPYWWGNIPGQAKAVLDRALLPGFAFKYHEKGMGWDKLLAGRTGDLLITSDTPPVWDRWVYGQPGRNALTRQVFKFVGIKPQQVKQIGRIQGSSDKKRARWLNMAEALGAKAALG